MLVYEFDKSEVDIRETANEDDVEFTVRLLKDYPEPNPMKLVQHTFEHDPVLTDALFYVYPNREYKVIVRKEYYDDFILELMRRGLLTCVRRA